MMEPVFNGQLKVRYIYVGTFYLFHGLAATTTRAPTTTQPPPTTRLTTTATKAGILPCILKLHEPT